MPHRRAPFRAAAPPGEAGEGAFASHALRCARRDAMALGKSARRRSLEPARAFCPKVGQDCPRSGAARRHYLGDSGPVLNLDAFVEAHALVGMQARGHVHLDLAHIEFAPIDRTAARHWAEGE